MVQWMFGSTSLPRSGPERPATPFWAMTKAIVTLREKIMLQSTTGALYVLHNDRPQYIPSRPHRRAQTPHLPYGVEQHQLYLRV